MSGRKTRKHAYKQKEKVTFASVMRKVGAFLKAAFTPRKWMWNVLGIFVACLFSTLLAEWISKADSTVSHWTVGDVLNSFGAAVIWAGQNAVAVIAGMLAVFLVAMILYALTASAGTSVLITGWIYCSLSAANYFKLVARNEPLLPWDFASIGAAAEFVGDAGLRFTPHVFIAFGGVLLCAVALFLMNRGWGAEKKRLIPRLKAAILPRLVGAAAFLLIFVVFLNAFFINTGWRKAMGVETNSWHQTQDYSTNGVMTMLLINFRFTLVERPAGYSESAIRAIREEVDEKAQSADFIRELDSENPTPNIIFVMLEAYGDADMLKNFTFSEEITKVSNWLEENAISGSAMTSIFGGGTSITEFMALTGYSTSFLAPGSTPYQQYVNKPIPAYPSYLRDTLGYHTLAIHPYGANYWNRAVAYPNLGIDLFLSKENCFAGADRCRICRYVTDDEVMRQVIRTFEEEKASSDAPLFIHAVTIANHQAYHDGDYPEDELVRITDSAEEISDDLRIAFENYLTGLRNTDRSLQILLDYFSAVEEPTILVIFGDHWGKTGTVDEAFVPAGIFDEGTLYSSHENVRRAYSVPFYIWDNYKGLHGEQPNLSIYQLVPLLTDFYGLDRPAYFDYLAQQAAVFRGHYSNTVLDAEGVASGKKPAAVKKAMDQMQLIQYDLMFGQQYFYKNDR